MWILLTYSSISTVAMKENSIFTFYKFNIFFSSIFINETALKKAEWRWKLRNTHTHKCRVLSSRKKENFHCGNFAFPFSLIAEVNCLFVCFYRFHFCFGEYSFLFSVFPPQAIFCRRILMAISAVWYTFAKKHNNMVKKLFARL